MTLFEQVQCLQKVHARTFLARALWNVRHSRLMSATIVLFLLSYLLVGYWLFRKGMGYVYSMPGVGQVLLDRIVYMVFFFFFLMLVFSNAVLLYGALFRGKETPWLLTLPISPRAVYSAKVVESFLVSSWGLAVLSAPLILSIGRTLEAPFSFYLKCLLVYVPFMVLPAITGAILVLLVVRFWGRTLKSLVALAIGWTIWRIAAAWLAVRAGGGYAVPDLAQAMDELLGHSEMALNRLLPSAWMSEMVLFWARGYNAHGVFYGLLLLSWALMLGWISVVAVSPLCYTAWNLSQQRAAAKTGRNIPAAGEAPAFSGFLRLLKRIPLLSRTNAALIMKDIREFVRDPAQWIPCALVFALLFLYAANLNRAAVAEARQPVFRLVLTYLNFGVCCLTLSTLTTRFIFPMFSLEGRRLWILGLSPVGMGRVFLQKLTFFAGIIGVLTCLLMLISGLRLGMDTPELVLYCCGIVLMSLGLTALGLGLGVLFPNFQDSSPARIVSGFGGTLCLILSFVYILLFMAVLVVPALWRHSGAQSLLPAHIAWLYVASYAGMILLTALAAGIPIFFSLRRVKRLELLGKL